MTKIDAASLRIGQYWQYKNCHNDFVAKIILIGIGYRRLRDDNEAARLEAENPGVRLTIVKVNAGSFKKDQETWDYILSSKFWTCLKPNTYTRCYKCYP